ncbi:MAG: hypothetical protein ACYC4U_11845 [Pirellulaceae bacterium]
MRSFRTRRDFLAEVGRGMLIASVGYSAAIDLELATVQGEPPQESSLTFGDLEPLVVLMQETPIERLVPSLVERLKSGTSLIQLLKAAALANARTFGGEDYVGFHTAMALAPAYHMAAALPAAQQPLPIFKVLYRNSQRIQEVGGRSREVLRPVLPASLSALSAGGELLRDAVRRKDIDLAEGLFAALAQGPPNDTFNHLLWTVEDNTEVHRVVLPYRAWDLLDLIGQEHAHTLLRQSVRYCVKSERDGRHSAETDEPRRVLARILDDHQLLSRPAGTQAGEDAWVEEMSRTLFESSPQDAAEAAAEALADGMSYDAVAEAISLAANQLVLRDAGRTERDAAANKPPGSVHGDSIGVHACDSANAWRHMVPACEQRNATACVILGAYQVAWDRVARGGDFLHWEPWPQANHLEAVRSVAENHLLAETEAAVVANDQARACALVHRYGEMNLPARPVFDLLLRFAISEDGALHAEKYYRTVAEEFEATRAAFRWRQMVALARVTASEYGRPAPGVAESRELLDV